MSAEPQNRNIPPEETASDYSQNPVPTSKSLNREDNQKVTFEQLTRSNSSFLHNTISRTGSRNSRRISSTESGRRRSSLAPKDRPPEEAYHDSRAATRSEFRRRATTVQEYYKQNPALLPQLPFTFRYGFKRWKLGLLISVFILDTCIIPIVLYYGLTFGEDVQGWITFADITAIWGGPTYFEFGIRSWRLISKERFFRPLGVASRWSFDITDYIFALTITITTALLAIGAAPHIVFLRVLSMPGPALFLAIGGCLLAITVYSLAGLKAPFRLSSTAKGERVKPGVYYIVEDIVAVNAGAGLPFREGLAVRYDASPVFRKMISDLSLFWCVPAVLVGGVCTLAICLHAMPDLVAYGIGWGIPFAWAGIWAAITVPWAKSYLRKEKNTWHVTCNTAADDAPEKPIVQIAEPV